MANPSKKKGTGAETELVNIFAEQDIPLKRTWPGMPYDMYRLDAETNNGGAVDLLATRPDRGQWLVTMRLDDFFDLLRQAEFVTVPIPLHIESKRYARFALHTIFEKKFGKGAK